MYRRVSHRLTLRTVMALTIGIALLPIPGVSLLKSGRAQGQREERKGKPKPGKPEGVFPDVEEAERQAQIVPEAPPPIPSTIRSKRNEGKPWDGRRVGDPEPPRSERGNAEPDLAASTKRVAERRSNQTRRAHARARMMAPPPPPHDQFVQNFFLIAVERSPASDETTYWYDQLRVAYANGSTSLKLAAIELGRTLFESAEYTARNRNAHLYVYDLYKTYLMREPDPGGWAMWEGLVPTHGREYVRRGFEESGEFATLTANITTSGSPSSNAASLISARVDPRNQPGRGMLSRDASWSVPLISLPGRAGLDLGLALSYSSMVWTRSGPYIYFDEDNGFPSPGFRLGFPTVQRKVFDVQTAKNAYLLVSGSGQRVELRQVGTSNIYDAADSSYLRLTEDGAVLRLHSTDGTRLSFTEVNGEFRCTEVKDRNGNYMTVAYNALGQINTITDTLGRVITFSYDIYNNPTSITQMWGGQPHTWATFGWITHTMQSSFGSLRVVGTANNAALPVLQRVGLPDGNRYEFEYTNAAQVSVIRRYRSGGTQPFYNVFQYESTTTDTPRLNQTRVAAENWTSLNGVPGEVTTYFAVDPDGACRMTAPDGTIFKEYYGTGWQKGLTTLSEVWSGGVKQKWTTTAWTQDNTAVSYEVNPRVTETNVYDDPSPGNPSGNRRRTVIDYGPYAQWGLPYLVKDYAANGTTEIRHTYYDYNLSQAYLDRRIIGLVSAIHQTNISSWQRKIGFTYDDPARLHALPATATQHDTSYNTSFSARGNVTAVSRWDVDDIVNPAKALTTYTNYFTTGTPKSTTDPSGHQNSMTYGDSFSDNGDRNTFAYPTTFTDADNFSSTVQYNFNFGAKTRTEGPPPEEQTQGAIQTITYDNIGRVDKITTENNHAYTRYVYGENFVRSFSSINNAVDEMDNMQVFDGVGRVIATFANHPGSYGGFRAQMTIYDRMGRAVQTSNPTEITGAWVATGDDSAGWLYTRQTYDWQGRPLRTTHPDTTYREASYSGCGCAGGEVVTLTDEGTIDGGVPKRRQQKIYSDVLGRTVKTEMLNWQGGSVYSATVNTYNARDQVTQVRQYAGPEGSGTYQDTITTYDGYGRLKTRHVPEQHAGTATTWVYNADDTVHAITDARGATSTFTYNNARHLPNIVTHTLSGSSTMVESFGYDKVGNRTSMTHSGGSTTYKYDQLSRLTSETQQINGLGSFILTYQYNLAGQLTSLAYPGFNTSYTYDTAGRTTIVTGPPRWSTGVTQYVSDIKYRASDSYKTISYGSGTSLSVAYNARLQLQSYKMSAFTSNEWQDAARVDAEYFADGRLRTTDDFFDSRFDRVFAFDHVGNLRQSGSAVYNQTFQYDAFGNTTNRQSSIWSQIDTFNATWINNRNQNPLWQYDASGNVRFDDDFEYMYDAKGMNWKMRDLSNNIWISQTVDADGQMVKRSTGNPTSTFSTTYYLRSTALGGKVVAEYNFGQQKKRRAYLDGQLLATDPEHPSNFFLEHMNPLTGSRGESRVNVPYGGQYSATVEPDSSGVIDVGLFDPNQVPPPPPEEPDIASILPGPGGQCRVEGIQSEFGCYLAWRLMAGPSALRCPNDDCNPRVITVTHTIGGKVEAISRFLVTAGDPGWDGSLDGTYVSEFPLSRFKLNDPDSARNAVRQIPWLESPFLRIAGSQQARKSVGILIPIDADKLKKHIQDRLKFKGCADYVKKLINQAAALGQPAESTDIIVLFERLRRQPKGGIFFDQNRVPGYPKEPPIAGGSGWAWGSYLNGNAMINVYTKGYFSDRPEGAKAIPYKYGITGLHEVIHMAARNDSYSDAHLTRAARVLEPDAGIADWNEALKIHCMPKQFH